MSRRMLLVGISIFALILTTFAVVMFTTRPSTFVGTIYNPPVSATDISLVDHNGQPFESAGLRGRVVLVFFGYTNCPEECPLTMAKLKQTFDILGAQGADAQVLLVTTDPVRDNAAVLKAYVTQFNPAFLGLTGTPDELQKVWNDYGVAVMDDGETHSNRVYVIDRAGNLRLSFPYEMEPDAMAADLKILLGEK